jgi:hypothetical protein
LTLLFMTSVVPPEELLELLKRALHGGLLGPIDSDLSAEELAERHEAELEEHLPGFSQRSAVRLCRLGPAALAASLSGGPAGARPAKRRSPVLAAGRLKAGGDTRLTGALIEGLHERLFPK